MQRENTKPHKLVALVFSIFTATAFVTFFSYTTSPIYHDMAGACDSPIFQIVGKYWAEGDVPYRDLWDLKGPYIFFVNMLGYATTGSRLGVFLLQILFMSFSIYAFNCLFRLYFPPQKSFVFTLLALACLSYMYEGGNMVEEYCLPFLLFSFLSLFKWLTKYEKVRQVGHKPRAAVLYGVTFALCLFSRLTNALGLCAAIAVVAFKLILGRQYVNLLRNAVAFLAGALIITIPTCLYFFSESASDEMWNATLFYGFEYAKHATGGVFDNGIHYFLLSYLCAIIPVLLTPIIVVQDRGFNIRSTLFLMSALFPLLWFISGNGFGHYGMITMPLFPIIIAEVLRRFPRGALYLIATLVLVGFGSKVAYLPKVYSGQNQDIQRFSAVLNEHAVDKSSFVAYNCDPKLYLYLSIRPNDRFFCLQDFAVGRNEQLRQRMLTDYDLSSTKWLLLEYEDDEKPVIADIIERRYAMVAHENKMKVKLFKLRTKQ